MPPQTDYFDLTGKKAMVVGAEHIKQPDMPTLDLVSVVGHVGAKVGRFSTGADQDTVFVIAELSRPEPESTTFLEGVASVSQTFQPLFHEAVLVERTLGEEIVHLHAETVERLLDALDHPGHPFQRETLKFLRSDSGISAPESM